MKSKKHPKRVSVNKSATTTKKAKPSVQANASQLQSALKLHQQGHLDEAEALYKEILQSQPNHFDALQLLATINAQKNKFVEAVQLFDHAIIINPNVAEAYNNRACALEKLIRFDDALVSYDKAVALKPDYAEAYFNRGNTLNELKHYKKALASFEKAVALKPDYAEAYFNRGNTLKELKHNEEALASFKKAVALKPDYAEAYFNLGNTLNELKHYEEALASFEKAIACKTDFTSAYNNQGNTLQDLKRYIEALDSFNKAIDLKPDYVEFHINRGNTLHLLKRYRDALASFDIALSLNPNYDFLSGIRIQTMMRICDWHEFDTHINQITNKIEHGQKASFPFPLLVFIDSPFLQKKATEIFVNEKYPANITLPAIQKRTRNNKIRIGYYSADFRNHPVSFLTAELFELHDKSKFELIAFSFGPDLSDDMRTRITAAFDRFIDVKYKSDLEIAQLSRKLEVDIAIDLGGFTADCRTGIFALRAAPIQVSYIGYLGTMGAEYIDYLIADNIIIPASSQKHYKEKIAYLPSYQANDTKRRISEKIFTRKESGLPETGFIFCCFNNNYKITPTTFDGWMRILGRVTNSVLWLFEDNPTAASNLRMEAIQRGIAADRLIFGKHLPRTEYLARYRVADLFLDTLPYNAGTTASDALWAGLPVLTCMGTSFASRVAASLLNALYLPELITTTQGEYEALAIELATHPEKLSQIKQKLENNRRLTPLFDSLLFTKHLEAAYTEMYERYHADLPPDHIYVEPNITGSFTNNKANSNVVTKTLSPQISPYISKLQSALKLHQQGNLDDAEALYQDILQSSPNYFDALQLLATIAAQKKNFIMAIALFDRALAINPHHADSYYNQGISLQGLKRYDEALLSYDKAIVLKPDYADAYNNRGNSLQALNRYHEALASYDKAIVLKPDYAEAFNNQGYTLTELNRHDEALASYDKAIVLKPDYADAYNNRGNSLQALNRYHEALASYDKAIVLKPDYADAYNNRGNSLQALNRYHEALASYNKAIELKPDFAEAFNNQGYTLTELNRYKEALLSYEKALGFKSDYEFLLGILILTMMRICDWQDFDIHINRIIDKIRYGQKTSFPFHVLALIDSPELQKIAAEIFVKEKYPTNITLPVIQKRNRKNKIRIGYYSADFHDHATAYLMAELFELHDKSKFELIAFSFGPDNNKDIRKRVIKAFDRFINVRYNSDLEVAQLSRQLGIDIAVDLKGFTKSCRTGIFALRAAPIQVNYLGYPGTMGAEYIDYILSDKTLIPINSQHYYTEKIIYLPNSYQTNDTKRRISEKIFTRKESGLPETGFIFCCFNNNYKITPTTFDGWMRILGRVTNSVLWLFEDNPTAASNLRMEAIQRGIAADRLIFGKRIPLDEHLARHRLADLFLDTLPCNAHTTASDALWAGLPVLTCMGTSFASRVAASLLNALYLPELITTTQGEYEALAIELATHPEMLLQIKKKLAQNRRLTPLFDSQLFTKHLEAAYTEMYERYHADLPPDHIYVEPIQ